MSQEKRISEENSSLNELIQYIHQWTLYVISKWKIILIVTLLAGLTGFLIAFLKKPKYMSESVFVLEGGDGVSGGLGMALGIGGKSSAGLFNNSNNIVWLYSSGKMLKETLLTPIEAEPFNGDFLVSKFAKVSKEMQKRIKKYPQLGEVKIDINDTTLSRQQESYLQQCVSIVKDEYLRVNTIKNTENIISVNFTSEEEYFSYYFTNALVKNVNDFYIQTKTKKHTENVNILRQKADSLNVLLEREIYRTASSSDVNPYANPNLSVLRVPSQRKSIDVQVTTALYTQVIQNLEVAKNDLNKETPIIQIVENPTLPLRTVRPSRTTNAIIGTALGFFFSIISILIRKTYKDALKK